MRKRDKFEIVGEATEPIFVAKPSYNIEFENGKLICEKLKLLGTSVWIEDTNILLAPYWNTAPYIVKNDRYLEPLCIECVPMEPLELELLLAEVNHGFSLFKMKHNDIYKIGKGKSPVRVGLKLEEAIERGGNLLTIWYEEVINPKPNHMEYSPKESQFKFLGFANEENKTFIKTNKSVHQIHNGSPLATEDGRLLGFGTTIKTDSKIKKVVISSVIIKKAIDLILS